VFVHPLGYLSSDVYSSTLLFLKTPQLLEQQLTLAHVLFQIWQTCLYLSLKGVWHKELYLTGGQEKPQIDKHRNYE
jgi:hypothetical protein